MTYPKVYVTGHKKRNVISRHTMYLTDSDYDYIIKEIGRQDTIYFERDVEVYSDEKEN